MRKFFAVIIAVALFALQGCYKNNIDTLNNKYEELSLQLKNYQGLLSALEKKLSVNSIEDHSGGYKIVFSDGSTIEIKNGKDGRTPVFTAGSNGNWMIDGVDSGIKTGGTDGHSPSIEIKDGYWYIDGNNTLVKAEVIPGKNGADAPAISSIIKLDNQLVFHFSDSSMIKVPMTGGTIADYADGFYIVNEGWFGHENGSVNFWHTGTDTIDKNIFIARNPGLDLGATTQFASIFNGRIYMVSKEKDLVVANARTMKQTGRLTSFNTNYGQGRSFCGIDANLGLLSTSKGIYKLNLQTLTIGNQIAGITGEVGALLKYRNYVLAVQPAGVGKIHIINTSTWTVEKTLSKGNAGLIISRDGMIWSGQGNELLKINPYTFDMEIITLPSGVTVPTSIPFGVFNAGALSASKQENALYFNKGLNIYKYVIGDINSLSTPILTLPSGRMIYGSGIRIHPVTNQVLVTTIDGYGTAASNNNLYFYDGTTGELKKDIRYTHYWFPAQIVFPEN